MKLPIAVMVMCSLLAAGSFPAAAQQAPKEEEYRLGPEDVIRVLVWGRQDLSGQVMLSAAGKVHLPLVGEITAAGLTTGELGRQLTQRYQILDPGIPDVIITVAEYNSRSVTVVGEVRTPGRLGLRSVPDIWGVLLAAGGTTTAADLARVQVVHRDAAEGEPRTVTVDLSRGIGGTPAADLPVIRPRDTIVVPSLADETGSRNRFSVLGAVRAPGAYHVTAASDLAGAISASGGALPEADLQRVRLTRSEETGVVSYELDLHAYLYEGRPSGDMTLRPGDTVVVPARRSTFSRALESVARLSPVISVVLGLSYYAFR